MWSAETKAGLARHLPDTLFVDLLGSTEAHGLGFVGVGGRLRPGHGHVLPRCPAMVIDDDGNVLGPGGTGLLAVGGPGPVGYHKDPDKTAATFRTVAGPAGVGSRRLGPGRGRRQHPPARPGVAVHQHRRREGLSRGGRGGARDAPGRARLDRGGGARRRPSARRSQPSCPSSTANVTADDLIAHVKQRIAGYKAPRHVLIVDDVGRAPNGKADYAGTRGRLLDHLSATSPWSPPSA